MNDVVYWNVSLETAGGERWEFVVEADQVVDYNYGSDSDGNR